MNRRTFLKSLGIGAVGAALGTANYDELLGSTPAASSWDTSEGDGWNGLPRLAGRRLVRRRREKHGRTPCVVRLHPCDGRGAPLRCDPFQQRCCRWDDDKDNFTQGKWRNLS